MIPRALKFEDGKLYLLDQRRLPAEETWLTYSDPDAVAQAITDLVVRGAPAIGVAAAYGIALAGSAGNAAIVRESAERIAAARPTAVNLRWAADRMLARLDRLSETDDVALSLLTEARAIHAEDEQMCLDIGRHGLSLLGDSPRILTYCNAGALATSGIGTALAPVYLAHESGRHVKVFACETRPIMQGARITTWELAQAGVDVSLLVDGAAALLIASGEIDSIWVGADRIAANGDVANKVGTMALACTAARCDIPFYVAAPKSTFDARVKSGKDVPIEFRSGDELSDRFSEQVSASGISYWTPAFDITPADLVSAYVTDSGIRPGGRYKKLDG